MARDLLRRGPFHVQLAVAEGLLGMNVAHGGNGVAVADGPFLAPFPLRHALAVEEHDGVAGRAARRAGIDHLRLRPGDSAHPFPCLDADQHRRCEQTGGAGKNGPGTMAAEQRNESLKMGVSWRLPRGLGLSRYAAIVTRGAPGRQQRLFAPAAKWPIIRVSSPSDGAESVLQVLKYPHPALRHPTKPLRRVDGEIKTVVRTMFDLMYEKQGIGLAANQVGLPYRLFILNLEADPQKGAEHVFLNPVISRRSGTVEADEGCLSFPRSTPR